MNESRRTFLKGTGALGTACKAMAQLPSEDVPDELILNDHLMCPGGPSAKGDPNAAFSLGGPPSGFHTFSV